MAHEKPGFSRQMEVHPMPRQGTLVNPQCPGVVVGDAGGAGPPGLTGLSQYGEHLLPLAQGQGVSVIQDSKETAHAHTSSSAATGSLTYSCRSLRYFTSSGWVQPAAKLVQDRALSSSSERKHAASHTRSTSCNAAKMVLTLSVPRKMRNSTVLRLVRFTQV